MNKNDSNGKKSMDEPRIVHKRPKRPAVKKAVSLREVAMDKDNLAANRPSLFSFTVNVIYQNLYILGITLLRRRLRYVRRIKRFFARLLGATYAQADWISAAISGAWKNLIRRLKAPFVRIHYVREELRPGIAEVKAQGKIPLTSYLKITGAVFKMVSTVVFTLLNHLAPVAAAILLIYTIQAYVGQPLGLAVQYNGETIGYVKSELGFESAMQTLRERFIETSNSTNINTAHYFKLVGITSNEEPQQNAGEGVAEPQVKKIKPLEDLAERLMRIEVVDQGVSTTGQLADEMVRTSDSEIEAAVGLYVNNRFLGAVTDHNFIANELEQIKQKNTRNRKDEEVRFTKRISVRDGLYPVDSIISVDDMDELINRNETVEQNYTVQDGDSPSLIADKTGLSIEQLEKMNPDLQEKMQAGEVLLTEVAQPFLSVQNIFTSVDNEEVSFDIVEIETSTFDKSYREITQEGVPGVREVTSQVTEINGVETARTEIDSRVLKRPVEQKVIVGTNVPTYVPPASAGGGDRPPDAGASKPGGFIWPTAGGRITVYVGGYPGHSGVDIPRDAGTPIYAADSGTVVLAKNGTTGYAKHVIIDHGNGYQTLYAHASQLFVTAGETVTQGQVIASVGRTGWATGNHLHFEVRYNGRTMQPQNYIGNRG